MSAAFHGPYAAMVTPFDEGAELSEPRLAAYCEFLIAKASAGCSPSAPPGSGPCSPRRNGPAGRARW